DCGNSAEASQMIRLTDTRAPVVLFSLPSELTVECGEPIPDIAPDFRDNCSDSLQISALSGIAADSCGYIIDRSWTATDDCGNSTTVTQRIYQIDTQSPEGLSVPLDTVLGCRDSLPSGMAEFSDACDSLLTISLSQDTLLIDSCTYEIIRIWTAADDCGNEVSAQQVVRFEDREAPFFFALDPRLIGIMDGDTLTVSCDAIPRFDETSMKAFDDCDGRPALTFEDYALALGDCANDGFTLLMYCGYRAVDRCGNEALLRFYVKVVDTVAPSVSGIPADVTANCGDTVSLSAPVFTDICDPVLTVSLSQDTVFAGNCTYEINRVWTATDDCGNSTTARQIVRISDTEAPVFVQTPGDTTLDCSVQMLPDTLGAVLARDNCDNELTYTYRDTVLSAACPRIILRRIVATDDCGNSAEASQMIRLTDTLAPVVLFSLPSELTVECGEPIPDIAPDFRDNCSDSLQISALSGIAADSCGYIIDRSWTATDDCGNSTTVTQRIYQIDTQSPEVLSVPLDTVLG